MSNKNHIYQSDVDWSEAGEAIGYILEADLATDPINERQIEELRSLICDLWAEAREDGYQSGIEEAQNNAFMLHEEDYDLAIVDEFGYTPKRLAEQLEHLDALKRFVRDIHDGITPASALRLLPVATLWECT